MEELKAKFNSLSEDEKVEFIKEVMPTVCELFMNNKQEMMQVMMPKCQEMMQEKDMDMSQMMGMMNGMGMMD